MAEQYPSDATLLAITQEALTGVEYIVTGTAPYYLEFRKLLYRLLLATLRANDLRVYDDSGLNVGIKAGKYYNGNTLITYAGASSQACTDNATNYVMLEANGTLVINTTGFPDIKFPHVRLATVVTAGADITTITDNRDESMFSSLGVIAKGVTEQILVYEGNVQAYEGEIQTY